MVWLRTGNGVLGAYFRKVGDLEKIQNYKCSQPKTVYILLKNYPVCKSVHSFLPEISKELNPSPFLGSEKCIEAVVKFHDLMLHLLNK